MSINVGKVFDEMSAYDSVAQRNLIDILDKVGDAGNAYNSLDVNEELGNPRCDGV